MEHGYEVFHRSVPELVRFYVEALGFVAPDGVDERTDYCVVTRDALRVGCCRAEDASSLERKPPTGSEIVLRVTDLQAEHRRVVESGWPIEDPVQERPWGMTDFRIFDPSGQYLRITGPAER